MRRGPHIPLACASKDRKKLTVGVSCPAGRARPCRGDVGATTTGRRALDLGRAKFSIGPGQRKTLTIAVKRRALAALRKLKKVKLKLVLTETDSQQKSF